MVKVYGTLRPEVYRAVLQAGEDARIPVVGHVETRDRVNPDGIRIAPAIALLRDLV